MLTVKEATLTMTVNNAQIVKSNLELAGDNQNMFYSKIIENHVPDNSYFSNLELEQRLENILLAITDLKARYPFAVVEFHVNRERIWCRIQTPGDTFSGTVPNVIEFDCGVTTPEKNSGENETKKGIENIDIPPGRKQHPPCTDILCAKCAASFCGVVYSTFMSIPPKNNPDKKRWWDLHGLKAVGLGRKLQFSVKQIEDVKMKRANQKKRGRPRKVPQTLPAESESGGNSDGQI